MGMKILIPVIAILCAVILVPLVWAFTSGEKEKISVLDPRGHDPEVKRVPLAPRPASLDGKTIYVLSEESADYLIPMVAKALQEQAPKAKVVTRLCPSSNCDNLAMYDLRKSKSKSKSKRKVKSEGKSKYKIEDLADAVIHGPIH